MNPILTAKVGTNADLFPDFLSLYAKRGDRIIDMTYGLGVFWKKVDTLCYNLIKNDLDEERGEYHDDFRRTRWGDASFDIVVLDPPYVGRSGSPIKGSIDRGYNNYKRVFELGIYGNAAVMQYYRDGMDEAKRILKPNGYMAVKCMDEIMGGKQHRNTIVVWKYAVETLGMVDTDKFGLVQSSIPTMRHDYQLHARKNDSVLWVFQKRKSG